MDIGAAKLRELQRELDELEESYETEYGDLSHSAASMYGDDQILLNPLEQDEEKENYDPESPLREGPPTLDDEDDGLVLMRTGNFNGGNVLQEVSHEVVVVVEKEEEEEVEFAEIGSSALAPDCVNDNVEESVEEDEELELVFVKEGVYQDPSTGKFYSLK